MSNGDASAGRARCAARRAGRCGCTSGDGGAWTRRDSGAVGVDHSRAVRREGTDVVELEVGVGILRGAVVDHVVEILRRLSQLGAKEVEIMTTYAGVGSGVAASGGVDCRSTGPGCQVRSC